MPFEYTLRAKRSSQSRITAIAFSADGVYIAMANESGGIFVIKSSNGAVALSLQKENTDISCITWTGVSHEEFVFADSDGYISTVACNEDGLMKVSVNSLLTRMKRSPAFKKEISSIQCRGFRAHSAGILFVESRSNSNGEVFELASSDRHLIKVWARSFPKEKNSGKFNVRECGLHSSHKLRSLGNSPNIQCIASIFNP